MQDGSDAGDSLASPPQVGESGTVTAPADLFPDCKVGDTYTVTAMDSDNVTLEPSSSEPDADGSAEGGDWGGDLVKHVGNA